MIWLLLLYAVFLVVGFLIMKSGQAGLAGRKEKALFATITSIGCVLWLSLLLQRPLDLNKAIGMAIDFFF
ncbi:hypothetical protein [Paenibacillus sacheonensis]|uniref:Uncharacterized protein n=1 Tax=Paenibacillus sacheonensis TaxID=742054 RepID=A0A7X4YRZ7_9BACL|nr:hypothetical protein [Paenibacillus sacheonensis]MBM7566348.1 hypothetical protein [Paenibacillus sacheonensis]NBC70551.1 hypothetical protein [Paenibacillus sacheonensis]